MTIAFGLAGLFCIVACLVFFVKLYMTNWAFGVDNHREEWLYIGGFNISY